MYTLKYVWFLKYNIFEDLEDLFHAQIILSPCACVSLPQTKSQICYSLAMVNMQEFF